MLKKDNIQLFFSISILLVISFIAGKTMSVIWVISWGVILFVIVGVFPVYRHQHNIWLFILTAVGSIPINTKLLGYELLLAMFDSGVPIIGTLIARVQVYFMLFTLQEIVVGIVGQMVWSKQWEVTEVWEEY